MGTFISNCRQPLKHLAAVAAVAFSGSALAASLPAVIDDFDHAQNNNLGYPRQFINDSMAGGGTSAHHTVTDGVIRVTGTIVPPRGQLGWATCVLPLALPERGESAAEFSGVLLRIRVSQGNMSLSVNSAGVTNFDYHAAPVVVTQDGQFHEVRIPFGTLKRAWSEQTPLDTSAINGISLVAYSMQPAGFDFEVDQVRFY